jgi:hypothetical protein
MALGGALGSTHDRKAVARGTVEIRGLPLGFYRLKVRAGHGSEDLEFGQQVWLTPEEPRAVLAPP